MLWGPGFLHQKEGLGSPHYAKLQLSWAATPPCHGLSIRNPPSIPTMAHLIISFSLRHVPTLLPGDLRFVPVLGSVLHKLDIGTSLGADVCEEGKRRQEKS